MSGPAPIFELAHATVRFPRGDEWITVVDDVGWQLRPGLTTGLVGESGSGKSLSALAALDLIPAPGRLVSAEHRFAGRSLTPVEVAALRGRRVGLVLQEPATAFNPVYSIGFQLREAIRVLGGAGRAAAHTRSLELLGEVELEPELAGAFPHQLSGGQLQRAMIALALAGEPEVLMADEPTTALDLHVQARILTLFKRLMERRRLALLLVSHDLAVVGSLADQITVMYAGRVVESGPAAALLENPRHPYTRLLLSSLPGAGPAPPVGARPEGRPQQPLPAAGCRFAPRCAQAVEECRRHDPPWIELSAQHGARCPLNGSGSGEEGS